MNLSLVVESPLYKDLMSVGMFCWNLPKMWIHLLLLSWSATSL